MSSYSTSYRSKRCGSSEASVASEAGHDGIILPQSFAPINSDVRQVNMSIQNCDRVLWDNLRDSSIMGGTTVLEVWTDSDHPSRPRSRQESRIALHVETSRYTRDVYS